MAVQEKRPSITVVVDQVITVKWFDGPSHSCILTRFGVEIIVRWRQVVARRHGAVNVCGSVRRGEVVVRGVCPVSGIAVLYVAIPVSPSVNSIIYNKFNIKLQN